MKQANSVWQLAAFVCGCSLLFQTPAGGQSSRKRDQDPPSERSLEMRLEKAEESLVTEYKDVANELYKQGNKERAMQMLQRLKQLNPKLDGLNDHIKSMREELMQQNPNELEVDTRKGTWEFVGDVLEDRAFRIGAKGETKLSFTASVGVEGLVTDEDSADYLPSAPLGCLIGVVVVDGKPEKPFPVLGELEHTPKKSGKFYVKVNVPAGCRCSGKIKLQVTGYIRSGR